MPRLRLAAPLAGPANPDPLDRHELLRIEEPPGVVSRQLDQLAFLSAVLTSTRTSANPGSSRRPGQGRANRRRVHRSAPPELPRPLEPVTLRRNGQPHLIVDGGLLSNFPVFLLDGDKPPPAPLDVRVRVFSGAPARTSPSRRVPRPLWQLPLAQAMFFPATEASDLKDSPRQRWCAPSGDVPTLKFTLSDSDRDMLPPNRGTPASAFARATQAEGRPREGSETQPPDGWPPPGIGT